MIQHNYIQTKLQDRLKQKNAKNKAFFKKKKPFGATSKFSFHKNIYFLTNVLWLPKFKTNRNRDTDQQ